MDEKMMELVAESAATKALAAFRKEMKNEIENQIKTHGLVCKAGKFIERVKWLLIGSFGSGVIGGGTVGAWLASALAKASPTTTWMQDVINRVFG